MGAPEEGGGFVDHDLSSQSSDPFQDRSNSRYRTRALWILGARGGVSVVGQEPTFQLSDDGTRLQIVVEPGGTSLPTELAAMRALAQAAGFGDFFFLEAEISKLKEFQSRVTVPTPADIAERRDGSLFVGVSKDEMEVTITITPAYGGNAVTREHVRQALREHNVIFGIDANVIDLEVAAPSGEPVVVARGVLPEPGEDGELVSKVHKVTGKRPQVRQDGKVVFRELGQFVNVKPGDLLMIRKPPSQGVAGTNVFGQVIPARPGKSVEFATDLPGAGVDPRDPDRLIAVVAGMPKSVDNGIYVDQNLDIREVDLSTGNVYFEGDVQIKGDVTSGMRVVATGNITIGGTVEAAYLEAGGDIHVELGVIGHGDVILGDGSVSPTAAVLKAGRNVRAHFLNNTFVDAGESVEVVESVTHSVIVAFAEVIVGAQGAKRGQIVGGRVKARNAIHVQTLGSQGDAKTYLEVGVEPRVASRIDDLNNLLTKRRDELEKLQKLADGLRRAPKADRPDLPEKIGKAISRAQQDIHQYTEDLAPLQTKLDSVTNACVSVARKVFGGVQVTVNGRTLEIKGERGPGVFTPSGGKLEYGLPVSSAHG